MNAAWYAETRESFLATSSDTIRDQLAARAATAGLDVPMEQFDEWLNSAEILQEHLGDQVQILRSALQSDAGHAVRHVILEYDFRRRGLRMDCLLLAAGALFVVEFKRNAIGKSERDQVMNYAVNLIEFHKVTQDWCSNDSGIVVPVIVQTSSPKSRTPEWPGFAAGAWKCMAREPLISSAENLGHALRLGIARAAGGHCASKKDWLESMFSPSSSILDATLSLYGNHDVSAIAEHAAPVEEIAAATNEIRSLALAALSRGEKLVVFLSGAPGAGKTLVGLDLVMRGELATEAVFVTGNAPLVDVLQKALARSYQDSGKSGSSWAVTGYRREDAAIVAGAATHKIVKAHRFLGSIGSRHQNADGRVLVFDEAQRTYAKGRPVQGRALVDHEANLVLAAQEESFAGGGAVVVALIGHNQAINSGEMGMVAWLEAADERGWKFAACDDTLELAELAGDSRWKLHNRRVRMSSGHLRQSMRFYRNVEMEHWADAVLCNDAMRAREIAGRLRVAGIDIQMTRDLESARSWARDRAEGGLRSGIIASGQARRLAAVGLFVDHKPDIANWMLAPSSDLRSSNSLETVQNQYQVQGLELDYTIVAWDLDLRRGAGGWQSYKIAGDGWRKDRHSEIALNGYRVLLTRSRRGLVVYVPCGDASGRDDTRPPQEYDAIAAFLEACGVVELSDSGQ